MGHSGCLLLMSNGTLRTASQTQEPFRCPGWRNCSSESEAEGRPIKPYHRKNERVTSFISMLRHLGGLGCSFWQPSIARCYPLSGQLTRSRLVLPPRPTRECGLTISCAVKARLRFRELLRAPEKGGGFESICGLSHREGDRWLHNPARPVHRLEDDDIRLPNRGARVLQGYTLWAARWMWSRLRAAARTTAVSARSSKCGAATFTRIPLNASCVTYAMHATAEPGPSSW